MKKSRIPHPLILIYLILLFVAALSWFIPTSVAIDNEAGVREIIFNAAFDGDGNIITGVGTDPKGLWDVLLAPIQGFASAADVSAAVLISGAFLNLLNFTGALDAGIGKLLQKFKGGTLITMTVFLFSIMGTVYGAWEELPAYALIIIPLFVMAGYDVLVGIGVIFVGALAGNMSVVVNPYTTGAAIAAIGNDSLTLGSGIFLRTILFFVLTISGAFLLNRYASKVKANKEASLVHGFSDINTLVDEKKASLPELTPARSWSLVVFVLMIVAIIIGYIPWFSFDLANGGTLQDVVNAPNDFLAGIPFIGNLLGASHFNLFGDWYFDEFTLIFLLGSILVAIINKMDNQTFAREFIKGCEQLLGLAIVLSTARGVSLIMGDSSFGINLTFVYWIQNILSTVPAWAFVIATTITFVAIGFFIQSTSGTAGVTMPILGAVAGGLFASAAIGDVGGQVLLISAFAMGFHITLSFYPTPTVMGILTLSNVPYNTYVKFILQIILPMSVLGLIVLTIAPYIGLAG